MRGSFPGWYARDPAALTTMWDRALFVPDANVLLHCLRHPEAVREELFRVFDMLRDSLWIPYQVGHEFHANRLDVEFGAIDTYRKLVDDYDTIIGQARERLRQLRAHPMIDVDREVAALDTFLADFKGRIAASRRDHPSTDIAAAVDRITAIFEGRVGTRWPRERLVALKKEGDDRYARRVPPGYMDAKKDGDLNRFGDLIIWQDMIAKAKEDERPIIFVTDDVKEDWWWLHKGRKLGPRPELVEEFQEASGQEFHIYEFRNFLRVAGERHPEIGAGIATVERSLIEDERARDRARFAAMGAMRERVSDLEDERERLVAMLSGTPGLELDRASIDRGSLRARLDAVNTEIEQLAMRLSGEAATSSAETVSMEPGEATGRV